MKKQQIEPACLEEQAKLIRLEYKKLDPEAKPPEQANNKAAGWDLFANKTVRVAGHSRILVPTGIILAIPEGCYGHIKDRSGNAINTGLHVKAGVVDSDYRGEVKVVILNDSGTPEKIERGDKIAQLIIEQYVLVDLIENKKLDLNTNREKKGFEDSDKK